MNEVIMSDLKFKCPACEHTVLEEVLIGVTQYSNCDAISDNGAVDYGHYHCEGGQIDNYQCGSCGYVLQFEPTDESGDCGYTITSEEELVEWLKEKACLQQE